MARMLCPECGAYIKRKFYAIHVADHKKKKEKDATDQDD